jgi:hypothetical protein
MKIDVSWMRVCVGLQHSGRRSCYAGTATEQACPLRALSRVEQSGQSPAPKDLCRIRIVAEGIGVYAHSHQALLLSMRSRMMRRTSAKSCEGEAESAATL